MSTPTLVLTVVGVLALGAVVITVLVCVAAGLLARAVARHSGEDMGDA